MGLYLTVFDSEEELDGVEVGRYADFTAFRAAVVKNLESGAAGSRFPTLILHSDCDGHWSPTEAAQLEKELKVIDEEFRELPPTPILGDWQKKVAKTFGIEIKTLSDCFFDVDGEPLAERLIGLARLSYTRNQPILFQ